MYSSDVYFAVDDECVNPMSVKGVQMAVKAVIVADAAVMQMALQLLVEKIPALAHMQAEPDTMAVWADGSTRKLCSAPATKGDAQRLLGGSCPKRTSCP